MAFTQFEAYHTITLKANTREALAGLLETLPEGITASRDGSGDLMQFAYCKHAINIDWSLCPACGMQEEDDTP